MKFTVTMKDPDGPYECVTDAVKRDVGSMPGLSSLGVDERVALVESRTEHTREFVKRWLRYGEYVDIEFDTEAGTATILPVSP